MTTLNKPSEGDTYIAGELIKLRDRLGLTHCVETGTQYGSTTVALAGIFDWVDSVEADEEYRRVAAGRLPTNATLHAGFSQEVLPRLVRGDTLYYLDAHGCEVGGCPLKLELEVIAWERPKNIAIVIHDFKVPGKDFGYDTYDYPLEWSEIESIVKRIFAQPVHYYNVQADGARRGVIFIHENY